jgi:hypothetical protein
MCYLSARSILLPISPVHTPPSPLPCAGAHGRGNDYWVIIPRASLADSLCPGLLSSAPTGLQNVAPRATRAKVCEKIIGFYRDGSRFIRYYRTEQARNSAFSRILSTTAFLMRKPGNIESGGRLDVNYAYRHGFHMIDTKKGLVNTGMLYES